MDEALFYDLNKFGVGAVLRDDCESVLLVVCNVVNWVCTVDIVEALAILRGLQFISHIGIQSLIVESDSQTIVTILNSSWYQAVVFKIPSCRVPSYSSWSKFNSTYFD